MSRRSANLCSFLESLEASLEVVEITWVEKTRQAISTEVGQTGIESERKKSGKVIAAGGSQFQLQKLFKGPRLQQGCRRHGSSFVFAGIAA